MMQIWLQLRSDLVAEKPDLDSHACGSQTGHSAPSDPRIRVVDANDDPGDSCCDDRIDARRGSSVVRARFQRHHQGRARRSGARSFDGDHLGMCAAWWLGRADTDDASVGVEHDSPDPRVR